MVAQANAAQLEIDIERSKITHEQGVSRFPRANADSLPWDTDDENTSILSQELMEKMLAMSLCDKNFTEKPISRLDSIPFNLNSFAPVIMKLLEIDSNLAAMHAKISPNMNEEVFWRNYYRRLQYLRKRSGIEGLNAQEEYITIEESEVLFYGETVVESSCISIEGPDAVVNITTTEESKEDIQIAKRREAELKLQKEVEAELDDEDIDLDIDDLGLEDELGDLDVDLLGKKQVLM